VLWAPADDEPSPWSGPALGHRGAGTSGARLTEWPPARPVEILALDAVEVGRGRIWRTDQPEYLLMNTPAGEVTMFSGPPDAGPPRAGAGPSLGEWWQAVDPARGELHGYAPRALYGRYLRHVFDTVAAGLPASVRMRPCAPGSGP
jgi:uncharacterized NAD(P)/FAD-binding protein YdhS